jgi:hypothetical protein
LNRPSQSLGGGDTDPGVKIAEKHQSEKRPRVDFGSILLNTKKLLSLQQSVPLWESLFSSAVQRRH